MARKVRGTFEVGLTALFMMVSLILFWPVAGYRRRQLLRQ